MDNWCVVEPGQRTPSPRCRRKITSPFCFLSAAKRRREDRRFLGADTIMDQLQNKTWEKRRVGLFVEKAPAREGTPIVNPESGEEIGVVTSGTFSPSCVHPSMA